MFLRRDSGIFGKGGREVEKVVGDEAEERPRMPFSMKVHITYESAIPCGAARAREQFSRGDA